MTFSSDKIPIFTSRNSDDLFLVIDQVFLIFPFFFQIVRILTVLNVEYDPFFIRKTSISEKNSMTRHLFYSVRTFARIRQHHFSKYWGGGLMHGSSPTSNFGGSSSPVPSRSPPLRNSKS